MAFFMELKLHVIDAHFANLYPKAHEEENPMRSKAQKPNRKTKEQEISKERSASKSNLQQNTNLLQNTNLSQNTALP